MVASAMHAIGSVSQPWRSAIATASAVTGRCRVSGRVGRSAMWERQPISRYGRPARRELEGVLEVAFGIVRATRPELDDAEVHQGRRARVVPEEHPVEAAGCRLEERADLGEHGRVVAATAREGEPGDGEVEPETCPPVGRDVLAMLLGQRDVRRRRPERMGGELLVGHERRELGLASSIRRQGREEAVDRGSLPVERERQAVLREEAARVVPRLGSLGVADRLEHVAMGDVPLGGGEEKPGHVLGARAAELQPQEIGQQMVVAERRPRRIDRDDEDVLVLEREEDPFGPGVPRRWSASGPVTLSRIEVRRSRRRTSAGWRASTSASR